ncbi:MAG: hypothetical protein PHR28_01955 [candidate division Zixibacteria bacterium]|nr:hypothetical protein [candidate division Zixibacteria bacterium]
MNTPQIYDIVLMLIGLNDNGFQGKTNIQKNIYLLEKMLSPEKIEFPCRFRPYFYGPFSREVSNALDLLRDTRLLQVSETVYAKGDPFDVTQTSYHLTPMGIVAFDSVKDEYPDFFSLFNVAFDKIKGTHCHEKTKIISAAAKIELILSAEGGPLTQESIKQKAQQLGWTLDGDGIKAAVKVLLDTGLAKKPD